MKKLLLVSLLVPVLFVSGCSALQTAQTFSTVINGILNIAQAEEAALPPADTAIMTPWVTLGQTLEAQLNSCIAGASGTSKGSAFATCFNAFAGGFLAPAELAQLRIMSGPSQSKAQLIATAIIVGVNGALTAYRTATQPNPIVAPTPASTADLYELRQQVLAETGL